MTFSLLLRQPQTELMINAYQHALLNAAMPNRVRSVLRRGNWTCNVCGVRLPGLMEIDHLDEHGPGPTGRIGRIAPICQFCHDLKHPLWAATRHRLVPVVIPRMDQRTLTRLCWIMISRSLNDPKSPQRLRPIARDFVRRRIRAGRMLSTLHMVHAFQALITISELEGAECAGATARRLDACVRLLPAAVIDLSALCAWTGAGFVPVRRPALRRATRQPLPPSEADAILARAGSLAGKGRGAAEAGDDPEGETGCGAEPDPFPAICTQGPSSQWRPVEDIVPAPGSAALRRTPSGTAATRKAPKPNPECDLIDDEGDMI